MRMVRLLVHQMITYVLKSPPFGQSLPNCIKTQLLLCSEEISNAHRFITTSGLVLEYRRPERSEMVDKNCDNFAKNGELFID